MFSNKQVLVCVETIYFFDIGILWNRTEDSTAAITVIKGPANVVS
jgi:hypothetical protein